ncbi:MAG: aminotransferase class I/II-fold pyridoxal phosphate-dependent enzyme [Ruminococcaceae bacterium]|nr:aminotransferase class I/II-fold pyridoxal phosphate-dependent enzyme [Oscillospiraceae bacterium]
MLLNENVSILSESGVSVKKRLESFLAEHPSATLLRLDQSLMNMPLPPVVTEGMLRAVEETAAPFGVRLSSPWSGYESLKKAIAEDLNVRGVKVSESEIFITSGLESAHACLSHLFAADNTVVLPSPCESHLLQLQQCAGRNVTFARALPENDFVPEPDSAPSDLIYLTSPSPVTGAPITREKLQKWVDYANENGSILFYDASLSPYLGEKDYPRSVYEIEGARSCAIQIFSFEKGYGVKELKIAYVIIPATLSRGTHRIRDLFCARQPATATPPSYVMQKAAELLLSREAAEGTEKLIYRIQKVAATLSAGLTRAGIPHVGAETSPYLWAQCPEGMNSWQCFDKLLEEVGCVVTPGSLFGLGGEGYFRLTAFGIPEEAVEAGERLCAAFRKKEEPTLAETEAEAAAKLFEEEETDSENV